MFFTRAADGPQPGSPKLPAIKKDVGDEPYSPSLKYKVGKVWETSRNKALNIT